MEQFYHIPPSKTQGSLQKRGEKIVKAKAEMVTRRLKEKSDLQTRNLHAVVLITCKMYVQIQFRRTQEDREES